MADEGAVPYDSGEWVDVGNDGRWRPSTGERLRAVVVLSLALGVLLALSAVLSVGDDGEEVTTSPSSTTEPEVVTTTSTPPTTQVDPASLDGEAPPEVCEPDIGREGAPLRGRGEVVVLVLNGTTQNGHAGAITDDLDDLGYETIVPANASRQSVTSIQYLPGFCAEGVRLVFDLEVPDAVVEPLPPDTDVFLGRAQILITLGADSV